MFALKKSFMFKFIPLAMSVRDWFIKLKNDFAPSSEAAEKHENSVAGNVEYALKFIPLKEIFAPAVSFILTMPIAS